MSSTLITKADLLRRITRAVPKDRANPDHDAYDDLLNEALGIISDIIGPIETSWTNAADGDLTLSGYTFALPTDCVEPQSVEWDGVPLLRADRAKFDASDDQWREATGTPGAWYADGVNVYLDSSYGSSAVGLLTLRGIGQIPEFPANDATSPNPLSYFPGGLAFQYAPAWYVIASLPMELAQPVSDKPEAIRWADTQTKMMLDVRQRHQEKWEQALRQLSDAYLKRSHDVFRY